MAIVKKTAKVLNIKQLKEFLKGIPDSIPIRGTFTDERTFAYLWKADDNEPGPKRYVEFCNE